jgi:hypothetical protein
MDALFQADKTERGKLAGQRLRGSARFSGSAATGILQRHNLHKTLPINMKLDEAEIFL